MKKFIIMVLSLTLVLLLSACGTQKPTSKTKTPSKEAATADNTPVTKKTDIKIGITPPAGWNPVADSVLQVQYMKKTASFMVKKEAFNSKSIDDVVKEAKEIFNSSFKEVKYIGETDKITVNGTDARKIVFTCNISGFQMKYEYVYLFAGGDIYVITFGDLAETFDSLSADYNQILKNITFK